MPGRYDVRMDLAQSYTLQTQLHETPAVRIFRGFRKSDGKSIVAKVLRDEYPSALHLARLRHEHEIVQSLDVPGVIRTLGLERSGNGLGLILEDAGDRSLDRWLRAGNLDLLQSLEIACGLVRTVAAVHDRGIVHKDLKPPHLFLDPDDPGKVTLVDFGIATRLTQERLTATAVGKLEGSLPYIAPEQTGRMNRVTDRRSDLYSVGVVLYELFTGRRPFTTNDALELVHCHLARVPEAPRAVNPHLPEVLSDIILKLLSKVAEDRYQSASGLLRDLEHSREQVQLHGTVTRFPLAEQDATGELKLPQKLYGREADLDQLVRSFRRVQRGASEFVLIAGHSGIGKSALVHELHRHLTAGGYFASGKFEYLNRSVPYAAITQACRALVQADLARPASELEERKQQLQRALGGAAQVMIDLVPELELVLGPQPAVPELAPQEAQHRLERVFQCFLAVFAEPGRPVVLFFDDLQWADNASLRLIQLALSAKELQGLQVLGAYRDNEVDPTHPLMLARDDAEKGGVHLHELTIKPLTEGDIGNYVADTLGQDSVSVQPLARVLVEKTRGNPFFLGQFLTTLAADGTLRFDGRRWRWEIEAVSNALATDNVVDFMLGKLGRLASGPQQLLQLAACIGHEFDSETLACVSGHSPKELESQLWAALSEGLLVPLDGNYRYGLTGSEDTPSVNARFRFLHDRVQQAAYQQLDDNQRRRAHLKIGRMLLKQDGQTVGSRLFDIVDHMNRGTALITDDQELRRLAHLNLEAGRQARSAAAAGAAAHYLATSIRLFGEDGWSIDYEATFAAHRLKAECDYLNGSIDEALAVLETGESRARTKLDRIPIRNIRTELLTNVGRLLDAVSNSVETIRQLGESVPAPDDPAALGAAIGAEFGAFQQERGDREIASFADLPEMEDPEHLALMETYAKTIPAAFQSVQELMVVIVCKAARLQLRHGRAPSTPFFHNQYGLVHSIITGDHATGFAFGQMGVHLADRVNRPEFAVTPHFIFGGFLAYWREPLEVCIEHLRTALRLGLEVGDAGYTGYAAGFIPTYQFYGGEPLEAVRTALPAYQALVERTDDLLNQGFLLALQQTVAALQGRTSAPDRLDDEGFEESTFEANQPPPVLAFYGAAKATVRFLGGKYAEALRATEEFHPLPNVLYVPEYQLFHALALAQEARVASSSEQGKLLERLREDLDTIVKCAEVGPAYFAQRASLVRAELWALEGKVLEALGEYDAAIDQARARGFIHHQALASELCARFLLTQGRTRIARPYLNEARYAYERWGARAKMQQLDDEFGHLLGTAARDDAMLATRPTSHGTTSTTVGLAHLDLATVVHTTETIATELVFETVLERLMRSLIENAGAQRGLLLLDENGTLHQVASMSVGPDQVRVGMSLPLDEVTECSLGVVRYVARTLQPIVLNDGVSDGRFRDDPYFDRDQPKSVLCVPMVHRGRSRGVLYLENNAAAGAFTPDRVQLLQFVATQAAAAVENARLYGELKTTTSRLEETNATLESQVAARTAQLQQTLSELWSEMDLARKIQTVLLPTNGRYADYEIAATMMPADSVGGDYYDVIDTADGCWVMVGDVSGHGVSAGLVMMMIQTAIRTLVSTALPGEGPSPAVALSQVNAAVRSNLERVGKGQYMTITALQLHGPTVKFSGLHLDMLVYRAKTQSVERVPTRGIWLGLVADASELLDDETLRLEPGDVLLLYTDGLTELRTPTGLLGTEAVLERFREVAVATTLPAGIVKGVLEITDGKNSQDDVTVMAIRYSPERSSMRAPRENN